METIDKNSLETCFQQLTWGFEGCRFRISYFQIDVINYLFTFVYNRYTSKQITKID